jgi:hypothetical protein
LYCASAILRFTTVWSDFVLPSTTDLGVDISRVGELEQPTRTQAMAISASFFMFISIGKAVGVLALELKFAYLPEGKTVISPNSKATTCGSLMVFQSSATSRE